MTEFEDLCNTGSYKDIIIELDKGIVPTQQALINLCKNKNIRLQYFKKILTYFENHDIYLDLECLDNAFIYNDRLAKYMIKEKNLKPNENTYRMYMDYCENNNKYPDYRIIKILLKYPMKPIQKDIENIIKNNAPIYTIIEIINYSRIIPNKELIIKLIQIADHYIDDLIRVITKIVKLDSDIFELLCSHKHLNENIIINVLKNKKIEPTIDHWNLVNIELFNSLYPIFSKYLKPNDIIIEKIFKYCSPSNINDALDDLYLGEIKPIYLEYLLENKYNIDDIFVRIVDLGIKPSEKCLDLAIIKLGKAVTNWNKKYIMTWKIFKVLLDHNILPTSNDLSKIAYFYKDLSELINLDTLNKIIEISLDAGVIPTIYVINILKQNSDMKDNIDYMNNFNRICKIVHDLKQKN